MEEPGEADFVQGCGSAPLACGPVPGWSEERSRACDLAVEVPGVELAAPYGFVDLSKLVDGERVAAEGDADRGVLELGLRSLDGVGQDLMVIEGEPAWPCKEVVRGVP